MRIDTLDAILSAIFLSAVLILMVLVLFFLVLTYAASVRFCG